VVQCNFLKSESKMTMVQVFGGRVLDKLTEQTFVYPFGLRSKDTVYFAVPRKTRSYLYVPYYFIAVKSNTLQA